METLKKVYKIFSKVERYCIFGVFFFATVFVVINVLGRKIFGFSFNWLEELNRYILVACTFVGASIAISDDLHPRMDSVISLFKGRVKLIVMTFATFLFTIFIIIMTYYSFVQLSKMMKISATTATLILPVYVFYAFIPIGFLGMSVRSIINLIFSVRDTIGYKIGEEGGEI